MKVLVVEDEKEMRQGIAEELRQHVDTVLEAADGVEAIQLLVSQPPDQPVRAIVSDVRMPRMDGITLLRELRSKKIQIPFIIVSAFYDKASMATAMEHGATDFIEKPFSLSHLNQVVLTALRRSGVAPRAKK